MWLTRHVPELPPEQRCLLAAIRATVTTARRYGLPIRACVETAVAAAMDPDGVTPSREARLAATQICETLNVLLPGEIAGEGTWRSDRIKAGIAGRRARDEAGCGG
jgi:hypothetical protein